MLEHKTNLGEICFSKNIINRIVQDAVQEWDGRVLLQNYRGRYFNVANLASRLSHQDEEAASIKLRQTDGRMYITVYVVVRFGTSISKVTRSICEYVDTNLESVMNERPGGVRVVVTGVLSRDIVRRNIIVTYRDGEFVEEGEQN